MFETVQGFADKLADNLEGLAALSRQIGQNRAYVQGGGGNTSLKEGHGVMQVKASGCALAEVTPAKGFVAVDYLAIRLALQSCATQQHYAAAIHAHRLDKSARSPRPSIETGFHALLGRVVVHSHAVWVNLLCCSEEGEALAKTLFPAAWWVAYATPGAPLTTAIRRAVADRQAPQVLLLQNHGLIISADTVQEAGAVHEQVNQRVREYFKLAPVYSPPDSAGLASPDRLLFPDQAVYLQHPHLKKTQSGVDTLAAYHYLLQTAKKLGLSPHFLPDAETEILLNMEAEQYRQKVAGA